MQLKHKNKASKLFKIKKRLKMKTLERCQWRRFSILIANCEHISNFVLIVSFEQANVWWVHIEKLNTFEDRIWYIVSYVAEF